MTHACQACGVSFQTKSAAAKYCSDRCRKRVSRRSAGAIVKPMPVASELPSQVSLTAQTLRDLEAAGLVQTSGGASALVLAERIDARQDTGAAVAALVREHRAVMAEVLGQTKTAATPFDELQALRERRRA